MTTAGARLPPLPRSLDPLPDESLPGYLLRLAHRLDLSPARLLELTGLARGKHPSRTSYAPMISLDTATRDTFSHVTRLTRDEADSLCLSSFAPRFPIPGLSPRRGQTHRADWWIFTTATRYCPDCLAGDGTPVQQAHGGPWRRSWRLPIVFACTQHRRLLQHACRACGQAAHHSPSHNSRAVIPLLQGLKVKGLHPAQCRFHTFGGTTGVRGGVVSACGARLDQQPADHSSMADILLPLQDRLTGLLLDDGPTEIMSAGEPAEPVRYFTDLRLITLLISLSWPLTRHLSPSETLTAAIEQHVTSTRNDGYSGIQPSKQPRHGAHTRCLDPAATAGMLTIADKILAGDTTQTRNIVQQILPPDRFSNRRGWRQHFLHHFTAKTSQCSPGLRNAVMPLVRAFPRQGPKARRAPELQTRFGPENVPAYLPDGWFQRPFNHLDDGTAPRHLQRTAAVRLVQMITGGSMGEAAHYLGLRAYIRSSGDSWTYNSGGGAIRWARNRENPDEFDAAIRMLAGELDEADNLINYRRRRIALQSWLLDHATWLTILHQSDLRREQLHQGTDRERQYASMIIWVRVTNGQLAFAPHPLRDQQPPEVQAKWSRRSRPDRWTERFQTQIEPVLHIHADKLANTIDKA